MSLGLWILLILFIIVSAATVMIILVQRPQGGGLAGAFGGAGGTSSDTVFGGRVGDALTWATIASFTIYLGLAIALNMLDHSAPAVADTPLTTEISPDGDLAPSGPAPATNPDSTSGIGSLTPIPDSTTIDTSPVVPPAPPPATSPSTPPGEPTGDPAPTSDEPAAPPLNDPATDPATDPAAAPAQPEGTE
jgi:preprotein translocase subunit SecG